MSNQQSTRPPSRRPPLGEATRRVNNAQHRTAIDHVKDTAIPHHESLKKDGLLQVHDPHQASQSHQRDVYPPGDIQRTGSPAFSAVNPRLSAISKDTGGSNSNRNSQVSTASTNASDGKKIKSYIGPWMLGKTLGKGATARVRKARHRTTGQEAAVKIVQKKNAQMSQAGSLAHLDAAEAAIIPDSDDETAIRRMPIGIQREVAIMTLIQHPNIVKLYDIWENRSEIYLVLEYVDNGELFEHITANGRLEEEEAMKYFRQILSAVGYCHSFNICHRDLKPENILINSKGDIKIADFGMAALHQSPNHKLETSCGSPHYAAPELVRGSHYRGEKVDTWSMGVILYATLAGRLPFDVESNSRDWLRVLLMKIRKGEYEMAEEFSSESANLIWRMLQVDPRNRISLNQIWTHPVIRKYDYLDQLNTEYNQQSQNSKNWGRPVHRRDDIDGDLVRQLRSMWHKLSDEDLIEKLLSKEPNDQKMFYSLLLTNKYAQLENYTPDLDYSSSDYHHVRPLVLSKTHSTSQFPRHSSKGHGRQVSRFTVVSNVAESERSYDPFKASRPQHLDTNRQPEYAKITIHRTRPSNEDDPNLQAALRSRRIGTQSRVSYSDANSMTLLGARGRQPRRVTSRVRVSRNSLASSSRSRHSAVRATPRYKRGVSFNHLRDRSLSNHKRLSSSGQPASVFPRHSNYTEVADGGDSVLRQVSDTPVSTYIRSKKSKASATHAPGRKSGRSSLLWHEDVRQLSSSLAKDCDDAFNRSSVASAAESSDTSRFTQTPMSSVDQSVVGAWPVSTKAQVPSNGQRFKHASLQSRPLPTPPVLSNSVRNELVEAREKAEHRKAYGEDSPRYLNRMVSHLDRLIQPISPLHIQRDHRSASAPDENIKMTSARPLPSINERLGDEGSPQARGYKNYSSRKVPKANRTASAPEPSSPNKRYLDDDMKTPRAGGRDTIRVVHPSSPSPVKMPAPLTIKKKSSQVAPSNLKGSEQVSYGPAPRQRSSGLGLRQQYNAGSQVDDRADLGRINEGYNNDANSNTGTVVKSKQSWYKRNSKSGEDFGSTSTAGRYPSQSSCNDTAILDESLPVPPKNKGFGLGRLFKKRSPKPDMSLSTSEVFEDDYNENNSVADTRAHLGPRDDRRTRQNVPQRSWFAKLFRVKPAAKYICFSVSKRRARQEMTILFKEWKRYGMKDIHVDKQRNIVSGRVGAKNFLNLKEVSVSAEIMTVIEHGTRSHLSIARVTQERGAASTFDEVIDTMESIFQLRRLLVGDERKKGMMVKTLLNASKMR